MNMSATAAARELGVAERTVRRWVAENRLAATRSGRELVIDIEEARRVKVQSSHGRSSKRLEAFAELRGRYLELQGRVDRLERELAEERRKSLLLEVQLGSRAA